MKQTLYMNLYRSGVYHRQGKPNTANMHGGDVYGTERAALEHAESGRGYFATVPFELEVLSPVYINGSESVPTPLHETRHDPFTRLPLFVPGKFGPMPVDLTACTLPEVPSLDTPDPFADAVSYEQWRANRTASGFKPNPAAAYKPVHGGYPGYPWPLPPTWP